MHLFQPQYEIEECLTAIREVLESGWTGYGPVSLQFEREWCTSMGISHSLYLNSATSSLHLALRVSNLPSQSPIITTPLTFVSPNAVILYEGHTPVFADISRKTLSLDTSDCLNKMELRSAKAAIWVHYAGSVSPDFYSAAEAFKAKNTPLIEDCAHAAGSHYSNGSKVGSLPGTIACFSYGSVKNLPTSNSGMLCTDSESLIERSKRLSYFGLNRDPHKRFTDPTSCVWNYEISELGWKYHGNDIAAAIALVQFKYLQRDNDYRRQIYEWYRENLSACPHVQLIHHEVGSSHHLVVIQIKNRKEVMAALQTRKIISGIHQPVDAVQSIFSNFYQRGDCPNFEELVGELLCLPSHLRLKKEDVDLVCELICGTAKSS
jgi:dTDP-4-amino-4,6-dideoxygalactose transaminase